jgi:hypothetical protein
LATVLTTKFPARIGVALPGGELLGVVLAMLLLPQAVSARHGQHCRARQAKRRSKPDVLLVAPCVGAMGITRLLLTHSGEIETIIHIFSF